MDVKIILKIHQFTMKIIDSKKLLTNEQQTHVKIQRSVIFGKKILKINMQKIENIAKLEIIVIIQGNKEVLHIAYVI